VSKYGGFKPTGKAPQASGNYANKALPKQAAVTAVNTSTPRVAHSNPTPHPAAAKAPKKGK